MSGHCTGFISGGFVCGASDPHSKQCRHYDKENKKPATDYGSSLIHVGKPRLHKRMICRVCRAHKVNRRQAREGALGYKVNRRQAREGALGYKVNRRQAREGALGYKVNRRQAREGALGYKVNRRQAREGALGYKVNRRQAREGALGHHESIFCMFFPARIAHPSAMVKLPDTQFPCE